MDLASLSTSTLRIALAGAALAASSPSPAEAGRGAATHMTVNCSAGRSFQMELHDRRANVVLGERRLQFARRPSSLGKSYESRDGALMIDGDFVAFVLNDDVDFRGCQLMPREG